MGTSYAAHLDGAAVLFMVGVENKQDIPDSPLQGIRCGLYFSSVVLNGMLKVPRIAQIVVRVTVEHADHVPVGQGAGRRHLGDEANRFADRRDSAL